MQPLQLPRVLLAEAFLPDFKMAELENTRMEVSERRGLINLLINNILQASKVFKEGNFINFDASLGDYGCQLQALNIYALAKSEAFSKELSELETTALKIKELMYNVMKDGMKTPVNVLAEFFKTHVKPLSVSVDMAYLLRAHLLTYVKSSSYLKDDIQLGMWNKLAGKPPLSCVQMIFDENRAKMSAGSVAGLQKEADKLSSLSPEYATRVRAMLSPEKIRKKAPKVGKPELSYACQFYSMKTVLTRLKEMGGLVLLKKWIMSKDDSAMKSIFFRVEKGEFVLMGDEEVQKLPTSEPLVVFEGMVKNGLEEGLLPQHIQKWGLEELIMVDTAQENQFEKDSDGLEFVTDPAAKEEIVKCAEKGPAMNSSIKDKKGSFFWLDHAYCSSVKTELTATGGK